MLVKVYMTILGTVLNCSQWKFSSVFKPNERSKSKILYLDYKISVCFIHLAVFCFCFVYVCVRCFVCKTACVWSFVFIGGHNSTGSNWIFPHLLFVILYHNKWGLKHTYCQNRSVYSYFMVSKTWMPTLRKSVLPPPNTFPNIS